MARACLVDFIGRVEVLCKNVMVEPVLEPEMTENDSASTTRNRASQSLAQPKMARRLRRECVDDTVLLLLQQLLPLVSILYLVFGGELLKVKRSQYISWLRASFT